MVQACIFISLAIVLIPGVARPYTIGSGITDPCHETMTLDAVSEFMENGGLLPGLLVPIPEGDVWRGVYDLFADELDLVYFNDEDRFFALSLLMGVRFPDFEGKSIADINGLHLAHDDPEKVYAHFIRRPRDDGPEGDRSAIEGSVARMIDVCSQAVEMAGRPIEEQIGETPYYDGFYGSLDVEVWMPGFYFGVALHAMQDSFSHTVRSDDLRTIRHVVNWIDATGYDYDMDRDGLAHSEMMDRCNEAAAEIVDMGALPATVEMIAAFRDECIRDETGALARVVHDWTEYEPGCTPENDFCDSKWADVARMDPSHPYLGCHGPGRAPASLYGLMAPLVVFMSALCLSRLRTNRRRRDIRA